MSNAMLLEDNDTATTNAESIPETRGILVALSSELVRWGLCNMLERLDPPRPVQPHHDVASALRLLRDGRYSLVIVDATDGEDALLRLTEDAGKLGVKVLVLLDRADAATVERIAALPADGFLVQSDLTLECMNETLQRLDRGDLPIPATMVRQLMARVRTGDSRSYQTQVRLTPREQDVLQLMGEGLSNKQIARRFGISVHGVKRHVTNVLAKLNCPNRTQAVSVALKQGLLGDG
ncbi:DNA-binding NarL/FixJ family response regulator [Streptomyces puniciscabiei]|uniref:DNA-binding NarL/FixJ family response regulator n=1 Tax=Streptomyces puniciscabiei TaxID=164348 RepID=A0A542UF22_9ACTN|nr:response regulator transcription factor [Streptomyces puniciscabiei]TQK97684.1 DNA-binding NarL/FixJ family response regulator [Streptomyces puniciscabiei]